MKSNLNLITMSILFCSIGAFAGPTENIKDYSLKVREAAVTFSKLSKEARGKKETILNSKTFIDIVSNFNLNSKDQNRIAQAIADGKTNVVTALYASMAAKTLRDSNQIDVNDMDQGIVSIMKMAAVSDKGVATNKDLKLTKDEMSDASIALKKKTEYSIDMLSWTKDDADTHIAVMKKSNEIYESLKTTPEEALVLAIMEVNGVDKDAAMKIVRKLRDCV